MTKLYRDGDLDGVLTPRLAVEALEEAFQLEADGCATVPARINAAAPDGWIRLMPAIVDDGNGTSAMGFKAMNLNHQTGVRYVVVLYDAESGELTAIMDAARLTRVRTAAVTAIACRSMRPGPVRELGIFGSGHEASGHAEVFAAVFPELERIAVYSPTAPNREAFAERMAGKLGIDVSAVDDPEAAAALPVVVLATKATAVVARSEWIQAGTLVLSIGSTRLDLRELDETAFGRTDVCVADTPDQLEVESGDVRAAIAAGHLDASQIVRLADVVVGSVAVEWPPRDLLVFKSVGTALQDLAVAQAAHSAAHEAGAGLDLGSFPVRR